jgi:DNA-directed RNA polymerase subunit RPC12/RpoP
MTPLALEEPRGARIDIDLCAACRVFWFDTHESLRLSPGSTLKLFTLMAEPGSAGRPLPPMMRCPRCSGRLALTHNIQRSTRFQYWQCPQRHGHVITFLEFLKEKDFIRPLTAQQIAELRQNVQTLNCSNCGGPIDLAKETVCPHCGSPLSMLDMTQMTQMVARLKETDQPRAVDPKQPFTIKVVTYRKELNFRGVRSGDGSQSIVEAGLRLVAEWLKDR